MARVYDRRATHLAMLDGRRRAWRRDGGFEVVSRDATRRYAVRVVDGVPRCECPAGQNRRKCYHAALVLARLMREGVA